MLSKIGQFIKQNILIDEEQGTQAGHSLEIAAAALLIEISRADATVSAEEEQSLLDGIAKTFSLTAEEAQALIDLACEKVDHAVSLHEFTREINDHYSPQQKIQLVRLLWDVAYADGQIDKYEDYYIRKISDLLYVSHKDFLQMKHAAGE